MCAKIIEGEGGVEIVADDDGRLMFDLLASKEQAIEENPDYQGCYAGPFCLDTAASWLASLLKSEYMPYDGYERTKVYLRGAIVRQEGGYNFVVEATEPIKLKLPDPSTLGHWGDAWLNHGKNNPWIREASDPPFDIRQFRKCGTLTELATWMAYDFWSVGAAFYYKDQCWINQCDGGSEFLGIKQELAFESFSAASIAGNPVITFWHDEDGGYHARCASRTMLWLPDDNALVEKLRKIDEATVEECLNET